MSKSLELLFWDVLPFSRSPITLLRTWSPLSRCGCKFYKCLLFRFCSSFSYSSLRFMMPWLNTLLWLWESLSAPTVRDSRLRAVLWLRLGTDSLLSWSVMKTSCIELSWRRLDFWTWRFWGTWKLLTEFGIRYVGYTNLFEVSLAESFLVLKTETEWRRSSESRSSLYWEV